MRLRGRLFLRRERLARAVACFALGLAGCAREPAATEPPPLARVEVMMAAKSAATDLPEVEVMGRGGFAKREALPGGRLQNHVEIALEVHAPDQAQVTSFLETFCRELGYQMGGRRQDARGGFEKGRCDWRAERGGAAGWLAVVPQEIGENGGRVLVVMDEW